MEYIDFFRILVICCLELLDIRSFSACPWLGSLFLPDFTLEKFVKKMGKMAKN